MPNSYEELMKLHEQTYAAVCKSCAYAKDYYGSGPTCYEGSGDCEPSTCQAYLAKFNELKKHD